MFVDGRVARFSRSSTAGETDVQLLEKRALVHDVSNAAYPAERF